MHERRHMNGFSEAEAGHRAERVTERGADQIRVEQIGEEQESIDGGNDDDDDNTTTMM